MTRWPGGWLPFRLHRRSGLHCSWTVACPSPHPPEDHQNEALLGVRSDLRRADPMAEVPKHQYYQLLKTVPGCLRNIEKNKDKQKEYLIKLNMVHLKVYSQV